MQVFLDFRSSILEQLLSIRHGDCLHFSDKLGLDFYKISYELRVEKNKVVAPRDVIHV